MTAVRHALPDDLVALQRTLVAAFHDDPWVGWMYRDDAARPEQSGAFFRAALEAGLKRGHTYATDGDEAVAVWSPPGIDVFDEAEVGGIMSMLGDQLGDWAGVVAEGLLSLASHHPAEPHFYLLALATDPAAQGKGLGGTLIDHILSVCDAQALPAYLESSNVRNVPFYERHGFEVVTEVAMPQGPVLRPMFRAPR